MTLRKRAGRFTSDRMPQIVIYESDTDNAPAAVDLTWDELSELLSVPRIADCDPCIADLTPEEQIDRKLKSCPSKNGQAWSPVRYPPNKTRLNENVEALTVAVIDLDHLSVDQVCAVEATIEGYAYVLHSTHSHRAQVGEHRRSSERGRAVPTEDCCLRLVLKLSRDVPAAQWPTVYHAIVTALRLPADTSCKDKSRLYFLPSTTRTHAEAFVYAKGEGDPLDVDMALAHSRATVPLHSALPTVTAFDDLDTGDLSDPVAIDLGALRERLKKVRLRKARKGDPKYQLLDQIIKGKPFCVSSTDTRSDDELERLYLTKGRQVGIHRAASVVAFCLPANTPTAAALELLRPCLELMDVQPEGLTHWLDKTAYSYEDAMSHRVARDLERKRIDDTLRLTLANIKGEPGAIKKLAEQIEAKTPEQIAATSDTLAQWQDVLLRKPNGDLKQCGENAFTIIALDENVRDTLSFDAVEKKIAVQGGPFHGAPQEILDTVVTDWLMRYWDLNLTESAVGHRILRVAYENIIDPLAEYLNGLEWDGIDRLGTFLEKYAGAKTKSRAGKDITEYVRTIGRKWMIGAVARALDPGCQMDTLLVLEGGQGEGKTSLCRILGGAWALETTLVLGEKDTMHLCATAWVIELGELVSVKKSDTNAMKAFLTRITDKFRPAYGRVPVPFPRRCVFVGTTNDDSYLVDPTGNRRFWPVACGEFDLVSLRRDRDQLWAQSAVYYRKFIAERNRGVPDSGNPWIWWMPKREQKVADEQTEERVESSFFEVKIAEWWYGKTKRPDQLSVPDIAEDILQLPIDRIHKGVQTEIGIAMRRLGFLKTRGMHNGMPNQYYYYPTDELKSAPTGPNNYHLKLVANAQVKR